MKKTIGAALGALLLLAVPATASARGLTIHQARKEIRVLVLTKHHPRPSYGTLKIDGCEKQSYYKVRCHLAFSDSRADWDGTAWSKLRRGGGWIDSNYSIGMV